MKELLRGKGTKSHMAEVPKRTPLATFTFTFYRPSDVIRNTDAARYVQSMGSSEIRRRTIDSKLEEMRRVGKSKLRWMDGVVEDLRKLEIQIWWLVATDRSVWRILREAEARSRL
jgi:hypothetical protein